MNTQPIQLLQKKKDRAATLRQRFSIPLAIGPISSGELHPSILIKKTYKQKANNSRLTQIVGLFYLFRSNRLMPSVQMTLLAIPTYTLDDITFPM